MKSLPGRWRPISPRARGAARPCRLRWMRSGWRVTVRCCWCAPRLGDGGRARRLLCRCGVPDHLLGLVAATPSLRRSWLLSVMGVLAVVTGEAAAVRFGWIPAGGNGRIGGYPDPEVLAPFLLVAPLLVLAGVAAAFLPMFDPAHRLAAAAPFSGLTLLLARTVSALAAALVPVVGAAFVVPGPGWLPVALLLPSLALCAFALAAATVMDPRAAAVTASALWVLPVLLLAATTFRWRSCSGPPRWRAPPCCAPLRWRCSCAVTASSWDG